MNLGSKQKLPCNQEKIPYIFTNFQICLNLWVRDLLLLVINYHVIVCRKAKKLFQNYCEPLLHLAGIAVTVIQTESENEARKIIMNLNTPTDAIIVAGGDGTLSDVLTGLVRKYNSNINSVKQCPIGILPLGQTNRVARSLYGEYDRLSDVNQIIEATMAIVSERSKMMDMIEVEPVEVRLNYVKYILNFCNGFELHLCIVLLSKDNPEEPVKPIYAMGAIEWGAWKDAHAFAKKYWYWGPLRKYVQVAGIF